MSTAAALNEAKYVLKIERWLNKQIHRTVRKAKRKGHRGLEASAIMYVPDRLRYRGRFGIDHMWVFNRTVQILTGYGISAQVIFHDCLYVPFAFSDQLEIKLK